MGRLSDSAFLGAAYPAAPGYQDAAEASREAAVGIAPAADALRGMVLARIKFEAATGSMIAAALGEDILNVRPRLSELRAARKIRPRLRADGKQERRRNDGGNNETVWELGAEPDEKCE